MYRYQPPKSSIWGHSLKNMQPAHQIALFGKFLERAVAEYTFFGGDLMVWDISLRKEIQRFENLLGAASKNNYSFHSLTQQQFDMCLNEIVRDDTLIPRLMLMQSFAISKWSVNRQAVATESQINLYYGVKPCISTFLQFDTVEQFHFVKKVLEDLRFCTLNEKYLKVIKRRTKTNAA